MTATGATFEWLDTVGKLQLRGDDGVVHDVRLSVGQRSRNVVITFDGHVLDEDIEGGAEELALLTKFFDLFGFRVSRNAASCE